MVILQRKKLSKPASQCPRKVLRPEGPLLTLLQCFQFYFFQILQGCLLRLRQKYVRVGQQQCQGGSPQGPCTNRPHPHGEETWILEERHFWRLRGMKTTLLFSQDSWNLTSQSARLQLGSHQETRGKGSGSSRDGTGGGLLSTFHYKEAPASRSSPVSQE